MRLGPRRATCCAACRSLAGVSAAQRLRELLAGDELVGKVRAAADARADGAPVLIARTDARAERGLDEAIDRVNRALEAGADVAFVEAPQTLDELADVPRRVRGPCLLNVVAAGRT